MAVPILDFWFEFASTYSYPAAMRAGPLANVSGVHLRWRPFMLGPIFKAQGWTTSPFNLYPAKGRNMWRDLERICGELGLPFRRPHPFPQNTLLAARVAVVGLAQPWGEEYCRAIYRAEFGEGRNPRKRKRSPESSRILGKMSAQYWNVRSRRRTRNSCARTPKRRSVSIYSVHQAL